MRAGLRYQRGVGGNTCAPFPRVHAWVLPLYHADAPMSLHKRRRKRRASCGQTYRTPPPPPTQPTECTCCSSVASERPNEHTCTITCPPTPKQTPLPAHLLLPLALLQALGQRGQVLQVCGAVKGSRRGAGGHASTGATDRAGPSSLGGGCHRDLCGGGGCAFSGRGRVGDRRVGGWRRGCPRPRQLW